MSRPFIVVGDQINHGGSVLTGSMVTSSNGKPVARVGDKVVCSQHGTTVIVSGDLAVVVDGQPVARHDDKVACGATLISTQTQTHIG